MSSAQKYHDVKFFIIAIAFISAFNYYLTYTGIRFNSFLLFTYTIDTIEGWLAWWAVRSIIIYLDKKMPYSDRPLKRILVQIIVTTLAGLSTIILLTELVSWIVKGRPALLNFYSFDIFIFIIWFLVINGIYIGMHYYSEWKESEKNRYEDKKIRATGYTIKHGKQNLVIPFENIFGFYAEDGYNVLLTRQGKKYLTEKSLDRIEAVLPGETFFRLNRQYIMQRNSLTGFRRMGDGKLDVMVTEFENFPGMIQVSRIRASAFKTWFQPGEA